MPCPYVHAFRMFLPHVSQGKEQGSLWFSGVQWGGKGETLNRVHSRSSQQCFPQAQGKNRKTGRKRGGRADHTREKRGLPENGSTYSKLEVGKVQPSLGHLTDDIFCHLHSETLTLCLSSSPPQSETDFHTEITPASGRSLTEETNICMREGDRISVPYFKIFFFLKKASEETCKSSSRSSEEIRHKIPTGHL